MKDKFAITRRLLEGASCRVSAVHMFVFERDVGNTLVYAEQQPSKVGSAISLPELCGLQYAPESSAQQGACPRM